MDKKEDIYIDRHSEYEAMRPIFESDGYAVHYAPDGEYPPGDALITCTDDDGIGMEIGDWGVDLPPGHTEGAAYYALGWLHGYECGYDDGHSRGGWLRADS